MSDASVTLQKMYLMGEDEEQIAMARSAVEQCMPDVLAAVRKSCVGININNFRVWYAKVGKNFWYFFHDMAQVRKPTLKERLGISGSPERYFQIGVQDGVFSVVAQYPTNELEDVARLVTEHVHRALFH